MHEKTDAYSSRERLLDHPKVVGLDPHELHAFFERVRRMTSVQLAAELQKLSYTD